MSLKENDVFFETVAEKCGCEGSGFIEEHIQEAGEIRTVQLPCVCRLENYPSAEEVDDNND